MCVCMCLCVGLDSSSVYVCMLYIHRQLGVNLYAPPRDIGLLVKATVFVDALV